MVRYGDSQLQVNKNIFRLSICNSCCLNINFLSKNKTGYKRLESRLARQVLKYRRDVCVYVIVLSAPSLHFTFLYMQLRHIMNSCYLS